MTTIADLRDALRIELHDEDDERWQDAVLDRHLQRAARELAFVWPREQKTALSTTAGSRDLSLASLTGLVRVFAVEYPVGEHPPAFTQFSSFGGILTLLVDQTPADAEEVNVYWGSLHTLDGSASTLPPVAEDAVVTGAAGYAAIEWASFATNRANTSGPQAVDDYLAWGERRLATFQAMLSRFGENGRLRSSRLFVPERGAASQTVVQWEP
jgi:hypothetical protein